MDVNESDLNISVSALKKALTQKTRAIVPVHVTGRAADVEEILKIARQRKLAVVEDAAEALMSKHQNKYLGTFGDIGCFSFSPNKTITTGQGGMIVTDNDKLAAKIRALKDQGRPKRGTGGDDKHDTIGYNFKFSNVLAAIGLEQLNYLKERTARMRRHYQLYAANLKGVKGLELFPCDLAGGAVPQWTDIKTPKRDALEKYLRQKNIDCRKYWFPIHTQKPYRLSDKNFPVSTKMSSRSLWLPSAFTLTDKDILTVCREIKNFFRN